MKTMGRKGLRSAMGGENGHRTRGPGPSLGQEGDSQVLPSSADLSFPRGTCTLPAGRLSQAEGRACSSPVGADGGWAGVRHRLCPCVQAAHGEDGHGGRHGAASSHADSILPPGTSTAQRRSLGAQG